MVDYAGEEKRDRGYRESRNPKIRKERQRTLDSRRREKQVFDCRQRSAPGQG